MNAFSYGCGCLRKIDKRDVTVIAGGTGLEVDALVDRAGKLMPIEIKSGATLATDWFKPLNHWLDLAGDNAIDPCLIFGGETPSREGRIRVLPWRFLAERETALISL